MSPVDGHPDVPEIVATRVTAPDPSQPLLVLGPSLGTTAATLWQECAVLLARDYDVLAWDLPGHGRSPRTTAPQSIPVLAAGVLRAVDQALDERGQRGATFCYAGNSVGGAVGLQLLLDHGDRVDATTLLCTGARIGTPEGWWERAGLVRSAGVDALVEPSRGRWFGSASGPDDVTTDALLAALASTDADSYAGLCEALADFDVTGRLGEIDTPVLAVAGGDDRSVPVSGLQQIVDHGGGSRLVVLPGVGHQAPAEAPSVVAALVAGNRGAGTDLGAVGMSVRRAVLGDAHVDRATTTAAVLTADFQHLVTSFAWGSVWARPGLPRTTRSMLTVALLAAGGHDEELALHLRAARRNGVTIEEIREVLIQTAVYAGVPAANTAFRIAADVLAETDPS